MFRFFDRKKERLSAPSVPDSLNKTATQIAIELIEGNGGAVYLKGMKRIFKKTPALINDVDPQYQEALKQILEEEA